MHRLFRGWITGAVFAAVVANCAWAEGDTVKLGQIEAQTGPNAIYGYMSSQGVPVAVDEINKQAGSRSGTRPTSSN